MAKTKRKILKKLQKALKNVEGFIMKEETALLYQLAMTSKQPIVEIGSWKGKSTICLAKGIHKTYCLF